MIYKRGGNSVEDKDLENDLEQKEESEEKEVQEETLQEEEEKKEEETSAKEEKEPAKENKLKRFGKKKDKTVEKLEEKLADLEDKRVRQLAEFENFRKRSEKEKSAMFETGAKSVVEKILPVVDNFERGLAGLSEEERKQPFAEGMNMVYKQLITELEKLEVKPIEAVGCEFNPELHNAVMQVESEEYESGIIAQELQKGYTYRDSVVRHSMVAVVQ